ncbi:MAG: T9SS type A sorting domain-containing protein, partial [bacterium]
KMAGISKDSSDRPENYNWDKPKVDTIIYDNFLVLNDLDSNFTYWMYVKSIGENNESEWSEAARLGTYKYETELSFPDIITPEEDAILSPGDINLIWTKFKYADYYFLKVRDLTDVNNIQVIFEENFIIDTTRKLTLLQPSSRYQIRLCSCKDDTTYSLTRVSYFYTWFEPLGVDDYRVDEKNKSLGIYPNPTNGKSYFVWSSEINENLTINVYDIRGNKILTFEKNLIAGEISVQINSDFLTAGLYFVEVKSSNDIKRGMFIKQ